MSAHEMAPFSPTLRFFSYVTFNGSGCWLWRGAANYKGYGVFDGNSAHRFAYLRFVGPLLPGLVIDHLCRNRACVNPLHLEQVTMRENYMRGQHVGATGICQRGHAITGDNLYTSRTRGELFRFCRTCRMASRGRWLAKQRAWRHAVPLEVRRVA